MDPSEDAARRYIAGIWPLIAEGMAASRGGADDAPPLPQRAWPVGWERDPRIDDGHGHQWERVTVQPSPGTVEPVTRCAVCLAPRCGNTFTPDPRLERRHHDGLHIYQSGRFRPLGGILPSEEAR